MTADKEQRKVWPEIITLLLGLTAFGYTIWAQPSPWFIAVPVVFAAIALVMLLRDSGAFAWCRKILLSIKANRIARREYPKFVKMIERARVHQELANLLRGLEWVGHAIPRFASMSFENWYNDIVRSVSQLDVKRVTDLELVGDRFRDLVNVINTDYFAPFSEALRQGHATYRNEQAMKSIRVTKEAYDRFLESYNEFCAEVNEKARKRVLVAIHNVPPALDWEAAIRKPKE